MALSLPLCAGLGVESGEDVRVTYTDGPVPPSLCWSGCRVSWEGPCPVLVNCPKTGICVIDSPLPSTCLGVIAFMVYLYPGHDTQEPFCLTLWSIYFHICLDYNKQTNNTQMRFICLPFSMFTIVFNVKAELDL